MSFWRINLVLIFFLIFGGLLVGRLFYIQIIKGDFNKAMAQGQQSLKKQVIGERGEVFFKDGEPLAVNIDWPFIFVSPIEIKEKETTALKLAENLSLEEALILEKLNKNSLYETIKKRASDQEIKKMQEIGLEGVYFGKESGRYYPQDTIASQLIGFLDMDLQGQYGIEEYYDEILQGKRNQKGSDLFLTIDYSIQFKAEKLLEQAKENLDIEGGEIIVINPCSGEILALANFPNFDPNKYFSISDFKIFKDGITQKIFEPGSVFKPIIMACALEEEKITPQTTYTDKGIIKIGRWSISNYDKRVYGEQTMTEVLEKSINTGAVFAEGELGHNYFLECLEKFGFFGPSGIDFKEVYSENKEFKKGYEINFATASFGQGIEMTPIQLVKSFAAIANNGKMANPYLVKKIVNSNNEEVFEIEPKIEQNSIISSRAAGQLTAMLVSVVENGFAKSAKIPGYYIAGKTGTSQISFSAIEQEGSGYSDKTWQSFVGFAPAFNPEFVILVKLDNPKARTAEYSALPIFQNLAKYILDYYQILPDYEDF
jgi:stage V sporulation protein D (sporulation-specific penicillin-binding protein)